MEIKNHLILLTSLLFLFFGCSKNDQKKEYYPDGTLKVKGEIKEGKLNGEFQEYYENSNLKRSLHYASGLLNGVAIDYYPNGVVKRKYRYVNDTLDGKVEVFFENGDLNKIFEYRNGQINGDLIEYDQGGNLYTVTTYEEGFKVRFRVYHPNGNLFLDEERQGEQRHGQYIVYFEDGTTIEERGSYDRGERDGWFIRVYLNGQVKDSVLFDNGKWQIAHLYDSLGNNLKSKENIN